MCKKYRIQCFLKASFAVSAVCLTIGFVDHTSAGALSGVLGGLRGIRAGETSGSASSSVAIGSSPAGIDVAEKLQPNVAVPNAGLPGILGQIVNFNKRHQEVHGRSEQSHSASRLWDRKVLQ